MYHNVWLKFCWICDLQRLCTWECNLDLFRNAELPLVGAATWLGCAHRNQLVQMCSQLWAKPTTILGEVDSKMCNSQNPKSKYGEKSLKFCCWNPLEKDCRHSRCRLFELRIPLAYQFPYHLKWKLSRLLLTFAKPGNGSLPSILPVKSCRVAR